MKLFDRYMYCIMQNLKQNSQVSIYSLADLNISHCVELTLFKASWVDFMSLRSKNLDNTKNNSHLSCIYFYFHFQKTISLKNYILRKLIHV